ncbi:unnamed protein product [Effrenium voratum]|nr:unnamed protein product [Effrenium voratum]
MDGTDNCYTHGGSKGKQETMGHLAVRLRQVRGPALSVVQPPVVDRGEYGFDGFRFGGVTSMLYHSHGIGKSFGHDYHQYFGMDADIESSTYLMLANYLVKKLLPRSGVTIAEDSSGMPTLCRPVEDGGFGFDYCMAVQVPGLWTKMLQEQHDEAWSVSRMVKHLQKKRFKEPCIVYAECHEQAIEGRTLASCLMGAEMCSHMSLLDPESEVIERGLALHKMIRLASMALGGEGYLNFMGNEFAHPDFVALPSEDNGWSHEHAIRRFDLPESADLKYKFFEAFEEAMLALENRFKFMTSQHHHCARKDDSDKVLVFEHGDCLFVFNFSPKKSFTEYRVGHSWDEGLRVVLDSDEPRFGGQNRLQWGHENTLELLDGWDSRPFSVTMPVPSRTVQVLVRESLLEGGVTVRLGTGPTSAWPFPAGELLLATVDTDGNVVQVLNFAMSQGALMVKLPGPFAAFKVYWEVQKGGVTRGASNRSAKKVKLPFALDTYRVHFPGTYVLDCFGNLKGVEDGAASSALQGDGVPPGCKDVPACLSRPQYVRRTPMVTPAQSEPEEPKSEPKRQTEPDQFAKVDTVPGAHSLLALGLMQTPQGFPQCAHAASKGRTLCELALPGAHNAGACAVRAVPRQLLGPLGYVASTALVQAVARPVAGVPALCQSETIGQLLRRGIRLLDLRLGLHEEEIYICHGVVCELTLRGALQEVRDFLVHHPQELVVLLLKKDWEHRSFDDSASNWRSVQRSLQQELGQLMLRTEDLARPVSCLVQQGRRALAMLELPPGSPQICGVKSSNENFASSWAPSVTTVEEQMRQVHLWSQELSQPQPSQLKVLELCLPGMPRANAPKMQEAFRKFLRSGPIHVATKIDFPEAATIEAIIEQNWLPLCAQLKRDRPLCAEEVLQLLREKPSFAGTCQPKMLQMSELLDACSACPFLCLVYAGEDTTNHWGYHATSCGPQERIWKQGHCLSFVELYGTEAVDFQLQPTFSKACEEAVELAIAKFPDSSKDCCVLRAEFIAEMVAEKCGAQCCAICKRCPGGFKQWCYRFQRLRGDFLFHKWQETSGLLLGLVQITHCFVVQLY